ncbi:MAG TPA: hypothetical protein V6D08_17085, partial [Candidatus Obscuribacterales bacterium]
SQKLRSQIKEAYRLLYRSGMNRSDALVKIEETLEPAPEIAEIVEFVRSSKRGVAGVVGESAEILEEVPVEAI